MKVNHLKIIAEHWNKEASEYWQDHPEFLDKNMHPSWGLSHIPEEQLGILTPYIEPGKVLLDLGCGCGHDSVAFASMGLTVKAIDISQEQLKNSIPHPDVEYILSSAEKINLPDNSIDIAISDHGAFDHSPPQLLLQEINRLLKPNGVLAICVYNPLIYCCYDGDSKKVSHKLLEKYPNNEMNYDGSIISVQLSHSAWIKAFSDAGFLVERLEEPMIDENMNFYFDNMIDKEWAQKWPVDIIWVLRKK